MGGKNTLLYEIKKAILQQNGPLEINQMILLFDNKTYNLMFVFARSDSAQVNS
jgi:hypothetical protein